MLRRTVTIIIGLVILGLCGCAMIPSEVNVQHNPQPTSVRISNAENISISVAVIDSREDKSNTVSRYRNFVNVPFAAISSEEAVGVAIKKYFEKELAARGFNVVSHQDSIALQVDVNRFYNDFNMVPFMTATADFNFNVSLQSKSGRNLYKRSIDSQHVNTWILGGLITMEKVQYMLTSVLEKSMTELFGDKDFISALVGNPAEPVAYKSP